MTETTKLDKAVKMFRFNKDEVKNALKKWKEDKYSALDILLDQVYSSDAHISASSDIEYGKVYLLNKAYGIHLFKDEIDEMAKYISNNHKRLNGYLVEGDESIISELTDALKTGIKGRRLYVFATKYSSFAAPESQKEKFPIFDRKVSAVYKYHDKWRKNENVDLKIFETDLSDCKDVKKKYTDYKEAVEKMREYVNLKCETELSIKELDIYLWMTMKYNLKKVNEK